MLAGDVIGFALDDTTFVVEGTSAADEMEFIAGTEEHILRRNGQEQLIQSGEYDRILFMADSLDDKVTITGIHGADDVFEAWEHCARMAGESYLFEAANFGEVLGIASCDPGDKAFLYGTDGVDCLHSTPMKSSLTSNGGALKMAQGFSRVYIHGCDGHDIARFYDGPGDDIFEVHPDYIKFDTPDAYIKAVGFFDIECIAQAGGQDRGYQYDTPISDLLIVTEERMRMISDCIDSSMIGFERTYAYSENGGHDRLRVYDNIFDENFEFTTMLDEVGRKNGFEATGDFMRFFSGSFYRRAEGFTLEEIREVNPRYLIGEVSPTGAVGVNIDFGACIRDDYYIEQQRYGTELIMAGLATANDEMTQQGIDVLQWGLNHQWDDGSFIHSGDKVHSTSMFLHALACAIEELDRFRFAGFDEVTRAEWIASLESMALWMTEHDDASRKNDLDPFSHRYFLRASGLLAASRLARNSRLRGAADIYLSEGLATSDEDGVMPERGDCDLSYQSLGLKYAGEFSRWTDDLDQVEAIREVFESSKQVIASRIDEEGNVDMSDSSRATEKGRNGKQKKFDSRNAVRAYLVGCDLTDDSEWLELATSVFQSD